MMNREPLTASDLAAKIETIERNVGELARDLRDITAGLNDFMAVTQVLLANIGDPAHVTVERAALLLGVSQKTVRRRIVDGQLTLETIPGTRESGIPIEQIHARWVSLKTARAAMKRQRVRERVLSER